VKPILVEALNVLDAEGGYAANYPALGSGLWELAPPIHRALYILTDDVVHPVGWDEQGPVCVLHP
jgi:hypothetical protein